MSNGFSLKIGTFNQPSYNEPKIVIDSFWIPWYILSCIYTFCDRTTGFATSLSMLAMKMFTTRLYNLDLTDKVLGGYSF